MAITFSANAVENSPPWLQGPIGSVFLKAFGDQKDWIAVLIDAAVKARMPLLCPSDALPFIGEERGLPRGISEPEAQYRARLVAAWEAWGWAGTPFGLLRAFQLAGYPNVLLQCQSGKQFQLGAGGTISDLVITNMATPVHLGGSPSELWSDIGVLILQPWPSWWGGSAPADGSGDQKTAAAMILKWKAAHNRCVQLHVLSGPVIGVGGLTVGSFTVGSGSATVWTPPSG